MVDAGIVKVAQHGDGFDGFGLVEGKGGAVFRKRAAAIGEDDTLEHPVIAARTGTNDRRFEGAGGGAFLNGKTRRLELFPGAGRLIRIEARSVEQVRVVEKDRGGESIGEGIGLAIEAAQLQPVFRHALEVVSQLFGRHDVFKRNGAEIVDGIGEIIKHRLGDIWSDACRKVCLSTRDHFGGLHTHCIHFDVGICGFEIGDHCTGRFRTHAGRCEVIVVIGDLHRLIHGRRDGLRRYRHSQHSEDRG